MPVDASPRGPFQRGGQFANVKARPRCCFAAWVRLRPCASRAAKVAEAEHAGSSEWTRGFGVQKRWRAINLEGTGRKTQR